VQFKLNENVSSTTPIRLDMSYSIGWSGAEMETQVFKMAFNPFALARRFAVAELWRFLVALFIDRFLPFFSGLCSIKSAV
jgi:hypothetical protein